MNWDQIEANWNRATRQAKQKWGELADDELTAIAGKRERLAGLLETRYGYSKEQAEKEVDEFARDLKP